MNQKRNIAWFITPHGFGHATRSLAIMEAWRALDSNVFFHIFSALPEDLLDQSIPNAYQHHHGIYDVGLVQLDALSADLHATVSQLENLLPYDEQLVSSVAQQLEDLQCEMVVCDVTAFGIAAGTKAGITTALVENFCWDWIYEGYLSQHSGFSRPIKYLKAWYQQVDVHIQTQPICHQTPGTHVVPPVSRALRQDSQALRTQLGIGPDPFVVLLTMGGVPLSFDYLQRFSQYPDAHFLVPGQVVEETTNVTGRDSLASCYHPDLIAAADLVVAKLGYSTVSEVYTGGTPMVYVARKGFQESDILTEFVANTLGGQHCEESWLRDGSWLSQLPKWRHLARRPKPVAQGAELAASILDKTRHA